MNLPIKVLADVKDVKFNLPNRVTALNPNAAEFIPLALRSTVGNTDDLDATRLDVPGGSRKAVLDRSESHVSNSSDDEVHQYWRHQLPDDITPDFKFMVEDELQGPGHLSLAGLSIHDGIETSRFSVSAGGQTLGTQQDISPLDGNRFSWSDKLGHSGSTYTESESSTAFMTYANSGERQFMNDDQYLTNESERHHYNGDSTAGFLNDLLGDHAVTKDASINPVEFLASQFPGFAAESLADVYYANECDLNLTIEILTQLELQVDGGFSQNVNSKALAAPNFNVLDFPALPVSDSQNGLPKYLGEDFQQAPNTYKSPSSLSRDATDFASAVRKLASQESVYWNYERNGSANGRVGASKSSQLLANSYNSHEKLVSEDKLRTFGASRAAPVWLETGEAVANMYSETREEARDFARLRNACFEQARQAYLIGNKALAKELSVKGQLYNIKMKEAHGKARETIYRQRNPAGAELQGYGRGQDCLIDLHGLHVNEAIHVLKHELSTLRSTARSAGKRLQVMICVGTGHHTKGARTPARLPVAVEQYLLEEGLHYTQPQPGLLRAVIS